MPWGSWVAAKKPSQQRKPTKAPNCQVEAPDQPIMCQRTKETRISPAKEAIMPRARPFLGAPGVMTMPRAFIQGLAKSAGEYQMAPKIHIMMADMKRAATLRLCR